MQEKQTILEALDQRSLLLPARVHDAMRANARVKYYLSLLQMASAHADDPAAPAVDLAIERERAGLDELSLDAVVGAARRVEPDGYRIPRLHDIVARIDDDLDRMITPVALAEGPEAAEAWRTRLEALREREQKATSDGTVAASALAWMTSADPERDGPHRLCMELHKEIDAIEQRLATDTIDGARVFGLSEGDRPLVAAFMRGVNRTGPLKFGHPGLGTTATRAGERLLLENDIGETDAHVLVVEVKDHEAVVTSADVHVQRIAFFQRMLSDFAVDWADTRSRRAPGFEEDTFFLCVGRFVAKSDTELRAFLERLGSRLVFLIDWNKARKALQAFVPKSNAVALLQWAANEDLGHRAFLELGGAHLVYDAMAAVMRTPLRFGERLEDALGVEGATDFMRFVLKECARGLLDGRSRSLIRERVRAELASRHLTAGDRLLEPVQRHAAIVQQLGTTIDSVLAGLGQTIDERARGEQAARAKAYERDADAIVVEVRSLVERIPDADAFGRIMHDADDVADDLEEAAFAATLMPGGAALREGVRVALQQLGDLVAQDCAAWVTCVEAARHAHRGGVGPEMRAFLDAVDRIVTLERETDDAERRTHAELMLGESTDARVLFVATRIAEQVETAADALMHAALELRDRVQGAVMIDRP
jgi:uncharacterized protein Yka (UPF0111/DUF47 family)